MNIVCFLGFFCGWLVVMISNEKKHKKIMREEMKKILEMENHRED